MNEMTDTEFKLRDLGSDAGHATSRSRWLLTVLKNLYELAEKKYFVSLKLEGHSGV